MGAIQKSSVKIVLGNRSSKFNGKEACGKIWGKTAQKTNLLKRALGFKIQNPQATGCLKIESLYHIENENDEGK